MNWIEMLLQLAPYVVVGVERIHADLSGPGKHSAAHDALTVATAAALAIEPKDGELIQSASQLTSAVIDFTVKDLNQKGVLTHGQPAPVPAAVAPAASPVVTVAAPLPPAIAQGDGDPAPSDVTVPADATPELVHGLGLHALTPQ